jgi:hypothetical protein
MSHQSSSRHFKQRRYLLVKKGLASWLPQKDSGPVDLDINPDCKALAKALIKGS